MALSHSWHVLFVLVSATFWSEALSDAPSGISQEETSLHKRDTDSAFDDFPDNKRLSAVDRLKRFPENERLIASIPSRIYEVIYPVQVRHHQKLGISTRDVSSNKTTKHYHQTSLLIKAFHYKFRLELELNDNLIKPSIPQKHLMPNGNWRRTHQEIEHCYYHGIVKDYPGALAAFRTCNGISGVIHIHNETFVIHPFYGGDLSRVHPHVIYKYYNTNSTQYVCGNSKMHQWGFKHFRKPHPPPRYKRDVREVFKYIELALVLDKAMFDVRNATHTEVMADAIQIINCVDMYFRQLRTRVSIVYIETWQGGDQIEKSNDIKQTLINFLDYSSKNLYQQHSDARHLLTGKTPCKVGGNSQTQSCSGVQEVGMAIPDTICTAKAVGVSEDTNVYEPHLVASTVTHMLGHNLGMTHDSDSCACDDPWGCIMTPGILAPSGHKGSTHVQPSHFSKCSFNDYISHVRVGHGVCLFNKPGQLEDFKTCGNGIVEEDEQCDCGSIEDCSKVDPCCDPITCRLRMEANCSAGACCENCKLKPAGHLCRQPESECDFPEFCDGKTGECPTDIFRQNGAECKAGAGYCYGGRCETPDEQCEFVWGFGATKADDACFEYNLQGMQNGNCGEDENGAYIKCTREHMMCGSLQCQRGGRTPIVAGMEKYTRMNIAKDSTEYECKSVSSREEATTGVAGETLDFVGLVYDGTKCGDGHICVNRTCQNLAHFRQGQIGCPVRAGEECSGHGLCSNQNSCYCEKGFNGYDCSVPDQVTTPSSGEEDDSGKGNANNKHNNNNKYNNNANKGDSTTANPAHTPTTSSSGSSQDNQNKSSTTPDPNRKIITKKEDGSTSVKSGNTTTTYVARKDALGAPSLVMVLVSVVGGVFIFFALLATCYRRSTMPKLEQPFQPIIPAHPTQHAAPQQQTSQAAVAAAYLQQQQQQKAHRPSMMGGAVGPLGSGVAGGSHPLIGTPGATPQLHSRNPSLGATTPPPHKTALLQALQQLAEDRIITFGSMPSYREDKLKHAISGLGNGSHSSSRGEETFVELSPNNLGGSQTHVGAVGVAGDWAAEADTLSEVEKTLKTLTGYTSDANTHSSYSYHEEILEALQQHQQQQQQQQRAVSNTVTPTISPGQDHKSYAMDEGTAASAGLTGSGSLRFRNLEDLLRQLEQQQPEEPEVDRHYSRHHTLDSGLRYLLQGGAGPSQSLHGSRCHSRASAGRPREEEDEAEESEESSNTYSTGQIAQQIQQRLRSASVEAIPIGGFPSPPSEESGSYDGAGTHTLPPLIPGPPVNGKRKVKRRRLPEYKV